MAQRIGGFTAAKEPNDDVRALYAKVKDDVCGQVDAKSYEHSVVSYATQVVAGTNFNMKVKLTHASNPTKFIHVKIYRDLKQNVKLSKVTDNVQENDAL